VQPLRARLPREQVNDVIGYALRGAHSKIVFDLDDPMGESTCVACGECVQACPTGALSPKTHIGSQKVDRKVDSVCPFCGVGCLITYNVGQKIVSVEGRDGPANHGRLCVKGRFGFDYAHHGQRLTVPLIRKPGVPKEVRPPGRLARVFREASWDEALDLAAGLRSKPARHATAPRRWRASARPRAATKRPTCSRSWCAPASAATTWTTARGCAMRPAWPRCSKAWARARSATRSTTWSMPS
jgi:NADH dehydrogenase/NADH:ubiquinone oxidoreductase subunit G